MRKYGVFLCRTRRFDIPYATVIFRNRFSEQAEAGGAADVQRLCRSCTTKGVSLRPARRDRFSGLGEAGRRGVGGEGMTCATIIRRESFSALRGWGATITCPILPRQNLGRPSARRSP